MSTATGSPGQIRRGRLVVATAAASVALLSVACANPAPTAGWPPPDMVEFVVQQGDSVIATERVARTLDRLEGEISMPGRARARYVAELTGPGVLRRLEARIDAWDGRGSEAWSVELPGDSVIVRSSRWDGMRQAFAVPAAAAYLHPSPALLELVLRRALITGDSAVTLPVWLVNQNTPATARLSAEGGRVRLDLANTRVYVTHENGYLLLAEVPAFGWTVHRR